MADESSQATAETTAAAGGEQSQQADTTTKTPTPDEVLQGDNVDAIRALMRENDNALVQRGKDSWSEGLGDESDNAQEQESTEQQTETQAAAQPGEGAGEQQTGETQTGEQTQAQEQAAATKEPAKKDVTRVRINRFNDEDRQIIARMAEKDGLTIDAARAELVAEGKLAKPEADTTAQTATQVVAAAAKDPAAEAITTQEAKLATLEAQMKEAAVAFDNVKLADLTIQHGKETRALAKLESQADRQQQAQQTQARTQYESTKTASEHDAVEMFPDAAKPGSALHTAIQMLIDRATPAQLSDPDYPVAFAAKAAASIGYKPTAATAKPTPPIVPKKPARPVQPASGSAPAPGSKRGPTLEQQVAEADTPEKIQALLREHGTRSLD